MQSLAIKGGTAMISGRRYSRILSGFVPVLLASAIAVAQTQTQPGGAQPQTNTMPNQPATTAPGTPGTTMGDMATDNNQQLQSMADQSFVRKALEGGAAEVQLGQLAQQKAQSSDVKQFGQKMVEDHTQLNDQMKPLAKRLNVKQPSGVSKKDRDLIARLEGLSGDQFDQAYIQAMVKDHKQDLSEFKDEAQATQNPSIKQAAQQGAQVIAQHLQMIEQIAQDHNMPDGKVKSASL
jgi:putative membrane protein